MRSRAFFGSSKEKNSMSHSMAVTRLGPTPSSTKIGFLPKVFITTVTTLQPVSWKPNYNIFLKSVEAQAAQSAIAVGLQQ